MNPKYKQYLDSAKLFRDQINAEQSSAELCKTILEEMFQSKKEDFYKGVFFGVSVVDELDAKNALCDIFKSVFKNADSKDIDAIFSIDNCDMNSLKTLHAMLAGYISSIVK
jgi:hypothetical protein